MPLGRLNLYETRQKNLVKLWAGRRYEHGDPGQRTPVLDCHGLIDCGPLKEDPSS